VHHGVCHEKRRTGKEANSVNSNSEIRNLEIPQQTRHYLQVDEMGQITKEKVDYLLKKEFPPSLISKANETFFPCAELALSTLRN
jgi:hypothetical protein